VAEVSDVGHKSGISFVFRRLAAPCYDHVDSELSSGLPLDCEPRAVVRRASRMGVGAFLMRHSKPKAAFHNSMSGQAFRLNGPFRTESLPYPRLVRHGRSCYIGGKETVSEHRLQVIDQDRILPAGRGTELASKSPHGVSHNPFASRRPMAVARWRR
jgi:hypothetical protein